MVSPLIVLAITESPDLCPHPNFVLIAVESVHCTSAVNQ